jgi:hypothetical protein
LAEVAALLSSAASEPTTVVDRQVSHAEP